MYIECHYYKTSMNVITSTFCHFIVQWCFNPSLFNDVSILVSVVLVCVFHALPCFVHGCLFYFSYYCQFLLDYKVSVFTPKISWTVSAFLTPLFQSLCGNVAHWSPSNRQPIVLVCCDENETALGHFQTECSAVGFSLNILPSITYTQTHIQSRA